MPPADAQGIGIPLSLFGGMVTELSPAVCPDGVSPDCQDIVFLPGSVKGRPCTQKLFSANIPNNVTMVYEKTFVQPNEQPLNLFLDSASEIFVEDVFNFPGLAQHKATLAYAPGSITEALSATQFGREYIASSDGQHGAAVPLQYDGAHFDRVTQDGPGAPPQVADFSQSFSIVASPSGLQQVSTQAIIGISEAGFICTVTIAAGIGPAFDWHIGDPIKIAGVTTAGYNGTFSVSNVQLSGLHVLLSYVNTVSGLGPDTTGTAQSALVEVVTTAPNTFVAGDSAIIAGAGVAGYDGTFTVRGVISSTQFTVLTAGFALANSGNGTVAIGGSISVGTHQLVVLFLTRQGYITKPSPPVNWTAAGSLKALVSNIPLGSSNVVARILAFTGAGGGNFFYIPVELALPNVNGVPTIVASTVIADNTSTSATINFSDNALFSATAIDIPGRNYFAQVVLSDCLGVFPFASRMFWWGERNKIQNLLNLGFEGGYLGLSSPFGWTVDTTGGALAAGGAWAGGQCWAITGDGTNNPKGQIEQPAYQDYLNIAILQPSTQYTFRCWAFITTNNAPGKLTADLFSLSAGSIATANIPLLNVSTFGGYVTADFSALTPVIIPADTVLRIYETGLSAGNEVLVDEVQIIPTVQPYRDNVFRVSYVNAPEQMDGVTGVLGSTSDPSAIRNAFQLRNTMYFHTVNGLSSTSDNGSGEPSSWSVPEVTQSVGSRSVHGTDAGKVGSGESGEQIQFTANENGLFIFAGGETVKISQEIQSSTPNGMPGWDSINLAAIQTIWVKNDIINRRVYVGAPTGTSTAPNVIFVLDYRELNDFNAIAFTAPYRQSLSGRLIAVEFCRKWTRWNLPANCGEILARSGGQLQFCIGAGNGQTPGIASGFGNVYQFSASKFTDDDYGQVTPYYTTYFFVTRDQEQQFQLDCHRKLASYLSAFISGIGGTSITPLSTTLANAFPSLPSYPLSQTQDHDLEWGMNVTGERIALRVGSVPAAGQTDNTFALEHLAMTLKREPIAALRGAL